jgi:hypothetical protein
MGGVRDLSDRQMPDPRKRILKIMAGVSVVGSLAAFAIGGIGAFFGFVTGSAMSLVNYLWLESSLRAMFAGRVSSKTIFAASRYVLRYVAIGGVLLVIHLSGALPIAAVISGLAVFAIAALIQGFSGVVPDDR